MRIIQELNPNLIIKYKEFQKNRSLWVMIEGEIEKFCEQEKLKYRIEFHHGGFSEI